MKTIAILLTLFLFSFSGFSQAPKFELTGRQTPTLKTDQAKDLKFVHDVTLDFWSRLNLSGKHVWQLNELLDRQSQLEPAQTSNLFPQPYRIYPKDYYAKVIEYKGVEISASVNGKSQVAKSHDGLLTPEQKDLMASADLGTNVLVKVRFQFRMPPKDTPGPLKEIIEGNMTVTVVPSTEAEFPGGYKQITEYFKKNVVNKVSAKDVNDKLWRAVVKFTVNEDGRVVNAKLDQKVGDPKIDELLISATAQMPKWKPAVDAKGAKVKQEIIIPFSGGGC